MSTAATATPRSVLLDPDEQRVIEERRARRLQRLARAGAVVVRRLRQRLRRRGRAAGAAPAVGAQPGVAAVLLLVAAYAAAFRLDFEIGTGSAVPTQLILVPMLFVLPVGLVPLAVAAGVAARELVDVHFAARSASSASSLRVVNAWHAVGPGARARPRRRARAAARRLAALRRSRSLAQFAFDFACSAAREWLALGVPPSVQLRAMTLGLRDRRRRSRRSGSPSPSRRSRRRTACCSPCRWSACSPVFARERRVRIDHELELRDAYRGTAFLLGDVVEADDEYTGAHSRDVVDLTLAVADELGLDGARTARRRVRRAAARRRQGARSRTRSSTSPAR